MSQNKLLAYLVTFISFLALISFALSPFFAIQYIEIQGLNILSSDELDFSIDSYYKTNIFFLNENRLKRDLLNISYIKDIKIKKIYPDTVILTILEREPVARINNNGKFILFTSDGFIVDISSNINRVKVPEIKGLGYSFQNDYIQYSPILNNIVQALEGVTLKTRRKLDNIIYQVEDDTLVANTGNIPIFFGQPMELVERFRILESILHKIEGEGLLVEYIDLRIINKPVIKLK